MKASRTDEDDLTRLLSRNATEKNCKQVSVLAAYAAAGMPLYVSGEADGAYTLFGSAVYDPGSAGRENIRVIMQFDTACLLYAMCERKWLYHRRLQ